MQPNDPAYPLSEVRNDAGHVSQYTMPGLTKREHIIIEMAKAVRISSPEADANYVAIQAVLDADALLEKFDAVVLNSPRPLVSAEEREWLQYAIEHMHDDTEPEDKTCAAVLQGLFNKLTIED